MNNLDYKITNLSNSFNIEKSNLSIEKFLFDNLKNEYSHFFVNELDLENIKKKELTFDDFDSIKILQKNNLSKYFIKENIKKNLIIYLINQNSKFINFLLFFDNKEIIDLTKNILKNNFLDYNFLDFFCRFCNKHLDNNEPINIIKKHIESLDSVKIEKEMQKYGFKTFIENNDISQIQLNIDKTNASIFLKIFKRDLFNKVKNKVFLKDYLIQNHFEDLLNDWTYNYDLQEKEVNFTIYDYIKILKKTEQNKFSLLLKSSPNFIHYFLVNEIDGNRKINTINLDILKKEVPQMYCLFIYYLPKNYFTKNNIKIDDEMLFDSIKYFLNRIIDSDISFDKTMDYNHFFDQIILNYKADEKFNIMPYFFIAFFDKLLLLDNVINEKDIEKSVDFIFSNNFYYKKIINSLTNNERIYNEELITMFSQKLIEKIIRNKDLDKVTNLCQLFEKRKNDFDFINKEIDKLFFFKEKECLSILIEDKLIKNNYTKNKI